MRAAFLGTGLLIFIAGLGFTSFLTATNSGISVPKIQKRSIRDRSVGHRRYHSGYRYGK